ncbi:coiled-coil domain-containing protein [Streptomyces sp. NPDC057963]|uniref:coiled-coil domain-containing protein n=1 Tax=Streptomyces sp. NPDC057963 TaxID=3346290 RepID=UPI0036E392BC
MSDRIRLNDLTDNDLDALHDQLVALYRERAHLVAHLAALHPSHIGCTDPCSPDWPIVIIETPAGQMSWHIWLRDMDLFVHVPPTNPRSSTWDGHTTDEKYQRLRDLTEATPSLLKLEVVADQQAEHIKQLTARIATLGHVAAGNRKHVAAVVPELEKAEARIAELEQQLADADAVHDDLDATCEAVAARDRAEAATARVRDLHRDAYAGIGEAGASCTAGCGTWPCPTLTALDGPQTTWPAQPPRTARGGHSEPQPPRTETPMTTTICAEYSTHITDHPIGPCVLRPHHRGDIHQDMRGIQWASRPGRTPGHPATCPNSPTGWHHYNEGNGRPESRTYDHCGAGGCCADGQAPTVVSGSVDELRARLTAALRAIGRAEVEIATLRADLRARDEVIAQQRAASRRALKDVCAVQRVRDLAGSWYRQGAPATSYARELLVTLNNVART